MITVRLGLLSSILMLLCIAGTAANDTLYIENLTVPQMELVVIPVHLVNDDTPVQTFSFHIHYDPSIMTFDSEGRGTLTESFEMFNACQINPGDVQVSGSDSMTGIPAGSSGTCAELVFAVTAGYSNLDLNQPTDDIAGFNQIDGSLYTCIPEMAWLSRSLPETCQAGVPFDVNYSYQGGTATVIETSETVPIGWTVLEPSWDEQSGNVYTWFQALSYCTILPPHAGVAGEYTIAGETVSIHGCNGEETRDITGDGSIYLWGFTPTPTPTPDCLHTGDVNGDGSLTSEDAQITFNIALGQYIPPYMEQCAANCNGVNDVTAGDAQVIFGAVFAMDSCVDPLF